MSRDTAREVARNLVSHPYRRILLALLDSCEPPMTTRALARAIYTYDASMTVEVDSSFDAETTESDDNDGVDGRAAGVEQMAAQLHHNHLPRLASAGLLTYDADAALVTEWAYPSVGDRWVTSPPVDSLTRAIASARLSPPTRPD